MNPIKEIANQIRVLPHRSSCTGDVPRTCGPQSPLYFPAIRPALPKPRAALPKARAKANSRSTFFLWAAPFRPRLRRCPRSRSTLFLLALGAPRALAAIFLFILFPSQALFTPTTLASTVVAWGETSRPPGSPPSMTTNVPPDLIDAIAVAGGPDVGYAIRTNRSVVTWGNPLVTSLSVVPADLVDVVFIGAGTRHALAVHDNGTVEGWGEDQYGKTSAPALLDRVRAVAVGNYHSLALRRNGTVAAWGDYTFGQPTAIPSGLKDVVAIAAAGSYCLALRRYGTVVAWGGKSGTNISDTVKVPQGLSNVVAIAASYFEAFALQDDGTVVHWGSGIQPGPIAGLSQVWSMTALNASGLLALKEDGTLVQAPPQFTPIPAGISNVVAIGGVGTPSVALIRGPDEPFITQHPQSQSVTAGARATFHVAAIAGQRLEYQWQFNGINLRGATGDTLDIKAAWPAQAGHYRVIVTAAGLPVTSRAAVLEINLP